MPGVSVRLNEVLLQWYQSRQSELVLQPLPDEHPVPPVKRGQRVSLGTAIIGNRRVMSNGFPRYK